MCALGVCGDGWVCLCVCGSEEMGEGERERAGQPSNLQSLATTNRKSAILI